MIIYRGIGAGCMLAIRLCSVLVFNSNSEKLRGPHGMPNRLWGLLLRAVHINPIP